MIPPTFFEQLFLCRLALLFALQGFWLLLQQLLSDVAFSSPEAKNWGTFHKQRPRRPLGLDFPSQTWRGVRKGQLLLLSNTSSFPEGSAGLCWQRKSKNELQTISLKTRLKLKFSLKGSGANLLISIPDPPFFFSESLLSSSPPFLSSSAAARVSHFVFPSKQKFTV